MSKKRHISCKDKTFTSYIQSICKRDEDKEENLTAHTLMIREGNKYKKMVQNGIWKTPDKLEKDLMVLKTEVSDMKKSKPNQQ